MAKEFDYQASEQILTDENKNMVFNWISGNRYADFENGTPVLKIQNKKGTQIARLGDKIVKHAIGDCQVESSKNP